MATAKNFDMAYEEIEPFAGWEMDKNEHHLLVDLPGFKKEQVKLQLVNSDYLRLSGKRLVNENKQVYFEKSYPLPENSSPDKITAKFDGEFLFVIIPKRVVDEETSETIVENENISEEKPKDDDHKHGGDQSSQSMKEEEYGGDQSSQSKKKEYGGDHQSCQSKKKEEYGGDQSSQCKKKEESCHGNAHLSFAEECLRKMEGEANNYLKKAMEILSKNKESIVSAILGFSIGLLFSRKFDREENP